MKRLLLTFALLLCATSATALEPLVVFDKDSKDVKFRAQGVKTEFVENGLKIDNGKEDRWPGVHFEGNWDLSNYAALEVTAVLNTSEPASLCFRYDCEGYDAKTLDGAIQKNREMKPGETLVWRIELPKFLNVDTRAKLFAMRGKPGGIQTDSYSKDAKIPFDKSKIVAFRPFITQDGKEDSWTLVSIVAIPDDEESMKNEEYLQWGPDKFFPMIDRFGQFKHADWPGKTHSLEELRAQIAEEEKELAEHQPTEFDQYGGWKNGPQLEATGSFRVEKIDGVWYFVDPEGRLFWSHGVDCVSAGVASTPVSDREFYFDAEIPTRPDPNNKLSQFLSESSRSVNNYYANYGKFWQFNFSAANLYQKYGDDWLEKLYVSVERRLRSWGMNTIGNWSDMKIAKAARIPYTATLNSSARMIEGSEGYWGKFVDPFAPEFGESVRKGFQWQLWTVDDPYCVGYFVDNEISWGEAGSLAKAALASPKDQPVKIAYIEWLKERYDSIEAFNAAWEVEVESWDALLAEPFKTPDGENAKRDSDLFYTVICEKYFSEIVAAVREMAPTKLYLGCRFAWTNELARRAGQKYCDVVSYNFYKDEVGSFTPVEGEDKPVIIGEFHFGALDRGLFHPGLGPRKDQNARAQAYEDYVRSALSNPWIVGAHWFEYQDEAVTGRFDGENYQIGLIDVCDRPYPETIEAVRRVGYDMYNIRAKK